MDAGYTGVEKRPEIVALGRGIEWRVAARRRAHKAQPEGWAKAPGGAWEKLKARARALVEPFGPELMAEGHPFHIIKNIFRHRKVRDRGLEKNTGQPRVLFARAHRYMVRRQVACAAAACAWEARQKAGAKRRAAAKTKGACGQSAARGR